MTTEWVRSYSTKYQDVALLYDYDLLFKQRLLRIRLNNNNAFPTPVTPTYQARFKTDSNVRGVPKKAKEHEPRNIDLCFLNSDNKEGETHRTVYNPYKPGTQEHKQLIQELVLGQNTFGFETLTYKGEVYNSNYELLLN